MPYSRWDSVLTAPDSGTVIAVAVFAADADRVFQALTDQDEIRRWWGGGRGGSAIQWQGKPERGASWEAKGIFSGGRSFSAWGEFLDVEPGHRYVQSWRTSWDNSNPSEASVRFKPIKDGTALTLVHHGFLNRQEACQAQAQMWWKVIKWLRPHLQDTVFMMSAVDGQSVGSIQNT